MVSEQGKQLLKRKEGRAPQSTQQAWSKGFALWLLLQILPGWPGAYYYDSFLVTSASPLTSHSQNTTKSAALSGVCMQYKQSCFPCHPAWPKSKHLLHSLSSVISSTAAEVQANEIQCWNWAFLCKMLQKESDSYKAWDSTAEFAWMFTVSIQNARELIKVNELWPETGNAAGALPESISRSEQQ